MELFDGCGGTAVARIVQVRKGGVTATVLTVRASAPRLAPLIHLAFAVPKGGRLDWLLEKATELGVAALAPVRFERSVAGGEDLSPAKRERWLGHCIAAAKQAGLCWLPAIENPQPLETFLASVPDGAGLFGDVGADAVPITQALCRLGHTSTVCIVIGPEGGLTPTEGIALRRKGLVPVRLGHTTLRVETAAVALVAAVLAVLET
jgi:16S rRNA (uracil1498-N3)-methyltransferase